MLELNKNLLINGNRYISQRRPIGSGTVTPTTSYQYLTNDRFAQKIIGTITTPTVEAASDFPIVKSPWCSKYTGITSNGSSIAEQQRVEADFGLELIGDYISLLTYVTSTSYSKLTVNIGYATAKDNHASQVALFTKDFTLKTDGSVNEIIWEKISQLSALISTGLYVELALNTPTNTSTSSTHRIGGCTLVRNRYAPTETILASRSLIDELRYCQRYYEKSYPLGVTPATPSNFAYAIVKSGLGSITNTFSYDYIKYIVTKRPYTNITAYSPADGSAGRACGDDSVNYAANSCMPTAGSSIGAHVRNDSGAAITPRYGCFYYHYVATSEL